MKKKQSPTIREDMVMIETTLDKWAKVYGDLVKKDTIPDLDLHHKTQCLFDALVRVKELKSTLLNKS